MIISKKALLRMKKDSTFRSKVYKSIEDIPWSSKMAGGIVKGNGVFIHEDGTGGYYMEFDWGDEDENTKSPKYKLIYTDRLRIKELNAPALDELSNMGLQAEVFRTFG